jgi:5-bromo-4-chloroindolyl phosphate hydrolysis protein
MKLPGRSAREVEIDGAWREIGVMVMDELKKLNLTDDEYHYVLANMARDNIQSLEKFLRREAIPEVTVDVPEHDVATRHIRTPGLRY